MTAKILPFVGQRLPAPQQAGKRKPLGPIWYCTRCGGERFSITSAGRILCGPCGAWMKNLTVVPTTPEGEPKNGR